VSVKVCTQLWTEFFIFRSGLVKVCCTHNREVWGLCYSMKQRYHTARWCSLCPSTIVLGDMGAVGTEVKIYCLESRLISVREQKSLREHLSRFSTNCRPTNWSTEFMNLHYTLQKNVPNIYNK
jgi:hypothetical protein